MTCTCPPQRLIIGILFLAAVLSLSADPKPAAPSDYAAAHNGLIALGLPALSADSKWVSMGGQARFAISDAEMSIKGNGWQAQTAEGRIFVPFGTSTITKIPQGDSPNNAQPKEAKLDADIAGIEGFLKKFKNQGEDEFRMAFEYYSAAENLGLLLIFSAQLRQAGHIDYANQLTHQVLNINPVANEDIIDGAINLIANAEYRKVTDQFVSDHDWAKYHQNLSALLTRFPRGWTYRDAVALCLEPIAQHAQNKNAPLPPLPDAESATLAAGLLTPTASAAASDPNMFHGVDLRRFPQGERERIKNRILEMVASGQSIPSQDSGETLPTLWLINLVEPTDSPNSIEKILAKGIHAFPLLAALAQDTTLTHIISDGGSSRERFSMGERTPPNAQQLLETLRRPLSRGEIAVQLLRNTLPDPSSDISQLPAADVAALAMDFWKKHKDKKYWELLLPFLDGDRNQRQEAMQRLSQSDDPAALSHFKKIVLANPHSSSDFNLAFEWIRNNPDQDLKFIEDYIAALRKSTSTPPPRDEYYGDDYAEEIAGRIKKIETLTKRQSPADLVAEILEGDPEAAEEAVGTLLEVLADKPVNESVLLLLDATLKAKDPTMAFTFLSATYQLEYEETSDDEDDEDSAAPSAAPQGRAISAIELDMWKKLLADTRLVPGKKNPEGEPATIQTIAAIALCYTYSQPDFYSARRWAPILKKPLDALLLERATALVNGQPPAPWPSAKNVKPGRLAEIVKSIEGKSATDILAIIAAFTPDEYAAWGEWLESPGDLPYPASLKELPLVVASRSEQLKRVFTDDPQIDKLTLPFQITAESLEKWFDVLSANIAGLSTSTIIVSGNRETNIGLQIGAGKITPPTAGKEEKNDDEEREYDYEDLVRSFLGAAMQTLDEDQEVDGVIIYVLRAAQRGKNLMLNATLNDGKITKNDDFTTENITEYVNSAKEAGLSNSLTIQIQILTREDAKKIQEYLEAQEEEEEDDEE